MGLYIHRRYQCLFGVTMMMMLIHMCVGCVCDIGYFRFGKIRFVWLHKMSDEQWIRITDKPPTKYSSVEMRS
jgi:hypothetical protein